MQQILSAATVTAVGLTCIPPLLSLFRLRPWSSLLTVTKSNGQVKCDGCYSLLYVTASTS
jgi:hypothetical protein